MLLKAPREKDFSFFLFLVIDLFRRVYVEGSSGFGTTHIHICLQTSRGLYSFSLAPWIHSGGSVEQTLRPLPGVANGPTTRQHNHPLGLRNSCFTLKWIINWKEISAQLSRHPYLFKEPVTTQQMNYNPIIGHKHNYRVIVQ